MIRYPLWTRLLSRRPSARERTLAQIRDEYADAYLRSCGRIRALEAAHESARAQWESDLREAAVGAKRYDDEIERLGDDLDAARVAIGEYRNVLARLVVENGSWAELESSMQAAQQLLDRPGADLGLPA